MNADEYEAEQSAPDWREYTADHYDELSHGE